MFKIKIIYNNILLLLRSTTIPNNAATMQCAMSHGSSIIITKKDTADTIPSSCNMQPQSTHHATALPGPLHLQSRIA